MKFPALKPPIVLSLLLATAAGVPLASAQLNGQSTCGSDTLAAPTVAVIGCGPGGMSFLHAIESRRRQLQAAAAGGLLLNATTASQALNLELARLPAATCLERAAGPGGVWRSKAKGGGQTTMYDGLWTNGPKEVIEFFDYTYEDHFGNMDLPVYMPRAALYEYMVARVTRHSPNLFRDHAKFQTEVTSVVYLDETHQFQVATLDLVTLETTTSLYDKVVWAAGHNGMKKMPRDVVSNIQSFSGVVRHSSETATFKEDVEGKNVLFVGASHSAEDLALMAIKLNAKEIHVTSRQACESTWAPPVIYTTSYWPYDMLDIYCERVPVAAKGRSVTLGRVESTLSYFTGAERRLVHGDEITLTDIDTIILATGYKLSTGFLEPRLEEVLTQADKIKLDVPDDWVMDENDVTPHVGDVTPGDVRYFESQPNTWRGVMSIDFPSFFVLIDGATEIGPLVDLEASAWLSLSLMTGSTSVPSSPEEMKRVNYEAAMSNLNDPMKRVYMDANYDSACAIYEKAVNQTTQMMDSDVVQDYLNYHTRYVTEQLLMLGERLQDGGHGLHLGTKEEGLTVNGKVLLRYYMISDDHRDHPPPVDATNHRLTFRDYEDGEDYVSMYTGRKAVSLPVPWLDIDGDGTQLILGRPILDQTHLFS